ncbi:hypothetical protein F3J37_21810 [Pantoea sp. Al-1710]|uniref:Uncharacterized protein n=1 Tax=Candidatus Pantoea communis TaxID=2608354 RepID=A0ABX0RXS6_9GAMM|nr:hypothetical protein [Pantoea communis]
MPQIKPHVSGSLRHVFSRKKNPLSTLISVRGFFYPHLPAIVKHGLSANDPGITRNIFLTYVRKN